VAQSGTAEQRLGLALSGGGHRAAFFHVGVLARLSELGLLRRVRVLSTVSGGSIVGALYYLLVKNLLETVPDAEITDEHYRELVRKVEARYVEGVADTVRGSCFASYTANLRLCRRDYSRTDLAGLVYERRLYRPAWHDVPAGVPVRPGPAPEPLRMTDLLVRPHGHDGGERFDPEGPENDARGAPVPILLLNATTLNTGHSWRFEATKMGEPELADLVSEDVDKNTRLARARYDRFPLRREVTLGRAVASSACFPGGFQPTMLRRLYRHEVDSAGPDWDLLFLDGGAHDNQGVEGLLERGCTHVVVSDGSGQLNDLPQLSARIPDVLGRASSIQGDQNREQRMLRALERGDDRTLFVHLLTGVPAVTLAPSPDGADSTAVSEAVPSVRAAESGVDPGVQRLLAQMRTDLDAFSEVESASLECDGYRICSVRAAESPSLCRLFSDGPLPAPGGWSFAAAEPFLASPPPAYLRRLRVSRQRFFKSLRLLPRVAMWAVVAALLLAVALAIGLLVGLAWGTTVPVPWVAAVVVAAGLAAFLYVKPDVRGLRTASALLYDVLVPLVLAVLPVLWLYARLQILGGRRYRRRGTLAGLARDTSRGGGRLRA
jgi:predicted acylesterase/phospholipase RssA